MQQLNNDHGKEAAALKWLERAIERIVRRVLKSMGMPGFLLHGVVQSVTQNPANSGKYYANVTLAGAVGPAGTNIPVNPDIDATRLTPGTPVFVMCVNFDKMDMFVLCRKFY